VASYLFVLTIGPVQSFIAAARRTRDLWAGSQLLSDLSREAAIYLQNQNATLIFPAPAEDNLDFKKHDVVNRIVAKVNIQDEKKTGDIKAFGEKLEEQIKRVFKEKNNQLFNTFTDLLFDCTSAKRQLADLLEISWAAVPFEGESYNKVRDDIERILAARKNTRDFKQPDWSQASQPKSSIDGQRESVIHEDAYVRRGDNDNTKKLKLERLWNEFNISGAERLSGVDLFKRHYQPQLHPNVDFPSTSHIAALPFIWRYVREDYQDLKERDEYTSEKAEEKEFRHFWALCCENRSNGSREKAFKAAIEEYVEQFEPIKQSIQLKEEARKQTSWISRFMPYDASILFDTRINETNNANQSGGDDSKELKQVREALLCFYGAKECPDKPSLNTQERPSPYYAILLADGDSMGQAIDKLANKTNGIELHKRFSQRLDQFASSVRNIVESHWGGLIYSGGDDVLALVPLHSLLSCAKKLHDAFDDTWRDFAELDTKPTLSMGIAIAHYMEPLSDTLNLARNAEKKAKGFPGKNALAITLSKRSGSDRTVVGSWATDFYQRLLLLIHLYRTNAIPDGYAFELEDLWLRLGPKIDYAILRAEAKRIAKRKHAGRGSEELFKLAETLPVQKPEEKTAWSIEKFVDEMVIASELSRALGSIVT
jgi:CRISPR-associated protein Cmr2